MRKPFLTLLSFFLFAGTLLAQVPQGINYQAVARNAQGLIIPAQNVKVRFSILDASSSGNVLYQETHDATTNNFGLFTLVIGRGVPQVGTFIGINWASGTDKFIKVEIAPLGGSTYELQSTTQLLSVPYALYSEKTKLVGGNAISITNGNTIAANYLPGTGINISGATISHALQAGPGVSITGATISGNYTGSNGVSVSGGNISGNYIGGTGISVTGATISHALQAGTGLSIAGATISGNYTGSNGVTVSGGNISGSYVGGTGINIAGSTVSHALQAGTGISISGATISSNLQAGTGISIVGNTISATGSGSSYWLPHTNGIYYNSNHVGIGALPIQYVPLVVNAVNYNNAGNAILHLRSSDTWHSAITMFNGTGSTQKYYSMVIAGPTNGNATNGTFGLFNHNAASWSFNFDNTTNNMAIGSSSYNANTPKSKLHVFEGDVNIEKIGSGIIMKSPNGNCYRITVNNSGTLVSTAITCP